MEHRTHLWFGEFCIYTLSGVQKLCIFVPLLSHFLTKLFIVMLLALLGWCKYGTFCVRNCSKFVENVRYDLTIDFIADHFTGPPHFTCKRLRVRYDAANRYTELASCAVLVRHWNCSASSLSSSCVLMLLHMRLLMS